MCRRAPLASGTSSASPAAATAFRSPWPAGQDRLSGGSRRISVPETVSWPVAAWVRAAELSGVAERRLSRLAEAAEAALAGGDLDRARRLTEPLPGAEQPIF